MNVWPIQDLPSYRVRRGVAVGPLVIHVQRVVAQGTAELVVLPVSVHADMGTARTVDLKDSEHRIDIGRSIVFNERGPACRYYRQVLS